MDKTLCQYHPAQPATWHCVPCQRHFGDCCIPLNADAPDDGPVCPLCSRELTFLGAANTALPFWERLPQFFAYGLQVSPLAFSALLALAGVRDGWVYYLPVDTFAADESYHAQRVRLHGRVAEAGLDARPALLLARFDLLGETRQVRVEYHGVIPDMFRAGRDVVVEGRLDGEGLFRADTLLTKCASKYETADGEAPHADPRGADGP